jgi:hypothetical protein
VAGGAAVEGAGPTGIEAAEAAEVEAGAGAGESGGRWEGLIREAEAVGSVGWTTAAVVAASSGPRGLSLPLAAGRLRGRARPTLGAGRGADA